MMDAEKRIQVLDFALLFLLVALGCMLGKFSMTHISNSILGFNIPAIGILVIGELIWVKVRGNLQQRWNKKDENNLE